MGGNTFSDFGAGPTPIQAFEVVRAKMIQIYGSRAYSGSIAEKGEIVDCGEAETVKDAEALADKLIDEDDPRIADKWGPAGYITIKTLPPELARFPKADPASKLFLFFGTASS